MMKNLFKSCAVALGLMLGVAESHAVINSYSLRSTNGNNIVSLYDGATRVNSITITTTAGGATNLVYAVKDAPLTNQFNLALSGYSYIGVQYTQNIATVGSYLTNITKITTNFTGLTYTNTINNVLWTWTNTAGGFTNAWDVYSQGVVASNGGSITINLNGQIFNWGISITNSAIGVNSTVLVDHDPLP